ncbi:hypothetical protein TNCV_4749451 [Trichonephila clavipes]|nr:hypothetical protein TNCV_4749451 [Trichonephila clavipes]
MKIILEYLVPNIVTLRRTGVGAKDRVTTSAGSSMVNYYDKNQGQECVYCCSACSYWLYEECVELERVTPSIVMNVAYDASGIPR